jgi:hypothetical protein
VGPAVSTPSHPDHSEHVGAEHAAELPCEPDDVPVRFLVIVSAAVTAIAIALIAVGVWLFNMEAASQFAAKGYPVAEAPAQ